MSDDDSLAHIHSNAVFFPKKLTCDACDISEKTIFVNLFGNVQVGTKMCK